ncbi:hypothetical protein ACI2K4_24940 [Micromonospora sp. NPDC050397]|uniref:hypothetical protein n=1 Tax=Micromonospora sp. NPDC050397 TaxID=3364279 RepID=UPI00384C95EB
MRIAGEEDPVHRTASLLPTGARLRTSDDHHVPGRDADDQLTGDGLLQVVPELVDQQHAGLQAVEGEHQRRWLSGDPQPVHRQIQVLHRGTPQRPPPDSAPLQVRPRHQALTVRWAEGVGDTYVVGELVEHVVPAELLVDGRHQQRQKLGARHLHP